MKIEFSRAGGFAAAAMRQNLEIDTDDLPQREAQELRELVSNADIKSAIPSTPAAASPDAFHYRIKVSDGDVTHMVTASDADMPAALNPLVDWLTTRASRKG